MKAIMFTKKDTAELVEIPMPEPKPGEVRVRLVRDTVSSGTERANLIGLPDWRVGIYSGGDGTTWPRQCGYSGAGFVDKVGDGVEGLKPGDRIAVSWARHQECSCIPADCAYPIPAGVPFADAALTHLSTFPMAALRKCRLEVGEGAIVMGQGILGQVAVKLLRAAGAAPVIAADPVAV